MVACGVVEMEWQRRKLSCWGNGVAFAVRELVSRGGAAEREVFVRSEERQVVKW